jgi:hypothetical protein
MGLGDWLAGWLDEKIESMMGGTRYVFVMMTSSVRLACGLYICSKLFYCCYHVCIGGSRDVLVGSVLSQGSRL